MRLPLYMGPVGLAAAAEEASGVAEAEIVTQAVLIASRWRSRGRTGNLHMRDEGVA